MAPLSVKTRIFVDVASLADDCRHAKGITSVRNVLYDHGVCSDYAVVSNANRAEKYGPCPYLHAVADLGNAIFAMAPLRADRHILINMTILAKNRISMNHAPYAMMLKA